MEKTKLIMSIQIEVSFADPQIQVIIPVTLSEPYYIEKAIQQSGILLQFPKLDLTKNKVGIFGKILPLNTKVQSGDRIEIYHALIIDPKKNRKQRAEKQKAIESLRS
ncbi:MAG: RnfH family protein [Rickettsiella sp.]|nr:RnfH family protein [Rickettsiella sp.]